MHIVIRAVVNAIAAARLTCTKAASRAPRADLVLECIDHLRVMAKHAISTILAREPITIIRHAKSLLLVPSAVLPAAVAFAAAVKALSFSLCSQRRVGHCAIVCPILFSHVGWVQVAS